MRLVTFSDDKGTRVGVHDTLSNTIIDLSASTRLPRDMTAFIALGKNGLSRARRAVRSGEGRIPAGSVKLHAPVPRPAKDILCVGKNYHEHAKEFAGSGFDGGAKDVVPPYPVVFSKPHTSIIADGEPILGDLDPTGGLDYEGELGVVIGQGRRGIRKSEALRHVFGGRQQSPGA